MQVHQHSRFAEIFWGNHSGRWLIAALLACYLIWGSTYYAIQIALPSFPPFFQMGTRFIAASAILIGWSVFHRCAWPTWRQWRDAAIAGALMIGGGMGLLACAQQFIHSSLAAAMTMLEPLLICVLSMCMGWHASKRELVGIGIGMAGILLLCSQGSFQAQPMGLLYMLGSVTCWSVGSVLIARYLKLAPGVMGVATQMLCGAVVLMVMSQFKAEVPQVPTLRAFMAWGYLVLAGSLGAYCAYMYLIKHTSPAVYTSYNYVTPVIALLIGVTMAGEELQRVEIVAMSVCLCGIVLLLSPKRQKK